MVLDRGNDFLLFVDDLLLVVSLFQEVFVDDCDRALCHLLLILFVCFGELVHDLLVAILDVPLVVDLRVKVFDESLLDVIGHRKVLDIIDHCS